MCPEKPAPQVKLSSNTGLAFVSICVPGAGLSSGQHVFCEKPPGAPCEVHATDNVVGAESCQACLCFVPKPVFVLLLQILSMWAPRSGDTSFPCSPWGSPGHLLHSGGCSGTQVVGHTPCHPIRPLVQLTSPVLIGDAAVWASGTAPLHLLTRACSGARAHSAGALAMSVCV